MADTPIQPTYQPEADGAKAPKKKFTLSLPKDSKYLLTLFPMLKEQRVKSFTTLVLTFIALIFFGLIAINPTLSTIADLQKQINDNTVVANTLSQKISNISNLQQQYTTLEAQGDITTITNAFPKDPQISLFIAQIQALATKHAVVVSRIQTFPVDIGTQNPLYTSFAFSLDVIGAFSDCQSFLLSLVNYQRVTSIDSVSISTGNTTQSALLGNTTLTIHGKAYFKSAPL